eukprot:TRINITY_DN2205_c1_g1_i1.p1 TRINITY_DN2205_c1_g1~~TRINITY_DN2205_c1_g1_i1.p1  ORF type:complete len:203 (-),score=68.04 TRINITY_DN2205_c1_g1_i1:35-643(-)
MHNYSESSEDNYIHNGRYSRQHTDTSSVSSSVSSNFDDDLEESSSEYIEEPEQYEPPKKVKRKPAKRKKKRRRKRRRYTTTSSSTETSSMSATSSSEEDSSRKKKRPKVKDPFMPKRPLSAWNYYLRNNFIRLKTEHPDWKLPDFTAILGSEWKALSEDEKAPYFELNLQDKKRYLKEFNKYQQKKAERKKKKRRRKKKVKN